MAASRPDIIEKSLPGAHFRIGEIEFTDESLAVILHTDDSPTWQGIEDVALSIGIPPDNLPLKAEGPTLTSGSLGVLLLVPVRGSFKTPPPQALASALHDALSLPDIIEPLSGHGNLSLWLDAGTRFMSFGDLIATLITIVRVFAPDTRPRVLGEPVVNIRVTNLDEKDFSELASVIEGVTWEDGTSTDPDQDISPSVRKTAPKKKAAPKKAAPKATRPSTSQTAQTAPQDPAPDLSPPSPEPETFNDAEFRFDRPVEGAAQDTLDRQAIAEAIAQKVTAVWREYQTPPPNAPDTWAPRYPGHPFIVHLAGRWGSGKSSILNFIAELLQGKHPDDDKRTAYQVALPPPTGRTLPDAHDDWVVIEFNAWRQQGTGHAWWALMTAVSAQAPAQIGARGAHFKRRDAWWRFSSSWRNWIIGGMAVLTLLLFWWAFAGTASTTLGDALKAIGGIITAVVGIVAFTGTFATRSKRTAEAIQNLDIDPTAALKRRFEAMIREIHNPVAIFIDDLDRCDAAYVVELLQALQTVYADVPVLYVVAADRNWLVSAYDQTYAKFTGAISEKGQALGYLFVKKIFQLSVNVPDLSDTDQRDFLKSLLPEGRMEQPPEQVLHEIEASVAGTSTLEGLTQVVAAQPTEATKRAAGRAALSKLMTEKTTRQVTHLLVSTLAPEGRDPLMDPNPRAITRLVNAYSFRLGYALRAGELGVIGKLPYWSVLDLRFPTAAKRLADKPDLRTNDAWKSDDEAAHFPDPEAIAPLLAPLTAADIKILRSFG